MTAFNSNKSQLWIRVKDEADGWKEIKELNDFPELARTFNQIPANRIRDDFERFIAGVRTTPEFTFTCHYDPTDAGQILLEAALKASQDATDYNFRLDLNGFDKSVPFNALVTGLAGPGISQDTPMSLTVTLAIQGQIGDLIDTPANGGNS